MIVLPRNKIPTLVTKLNLNVQTYGPDDKLKFQTDLHCNPNTTRLVLCSIKIKILVLFGLVKKAIKSITLSCAYWSTIQMLRLEEEKCAKMF